MEKESKIKDYVYNTMRKFYLEHSRAFDEFPNEGKTKDILEILVGEDLSDYKIDLRELKDDVLRQKKNEIKVYNLFRDYCLGYSRDHNKFPTVRKAKKALKIPINRKLSDYGIKLDNLILGVLRQRIENDIYGKGLDPKKDEINKKLGKNINVWVERLGFDNFSDMRSHYTGKKGRNIRMFKTIEEASQAFENQLLKHLREGEGLLPIKNIGKNLKTDYTTYFKKPGDIKAMKIKVLKQVFEEIHKEKIDLTKNEIEDKLKIGLYNWPELLGHHSLRDYKKQRNKIVNSMTGDTIKEKNEKLITYVSLIRQKIDEKKKKITEGNMYDFIKKKIGNSPNTFDVSNAINYLLYVKEIEGNRLNGYLRKE